MGVADRFAVLRQRGFRWLWTAGVISIAGDWVLLVGLPFYVFRLTGSTLSTALTLLSGVCPQVVVGSFAGVFVDRWDRRRTMIFADLVMAAGLLPLLWVRSPSTLWIVYAVAALESSADQFFGPAEGSLMPHLVGETELLDANAVYGSGRQLSRLVGAAVGGVTVGLAGIAGISLLDAATFLVSAGVLLLGVAGRTVWATGRAPGAASPWAALRRFAREWRSGLRLAAGRSIARDVLIYTVIVFVGEGVVGTLFAPFMVAVLHGNGVDYGVFLSLQAGGGIAGGFAVVALGARWSPTRVLVRSSVIFGVLDLVLFNYPLAWGILGPAFLLIVAVGLPAAALNAALSSLQQTAVAESFRGRYLGTLSALASASMIVGILLAGFLGDRVGIIPILEIQGVGYIVAAFVFWAAVRQPSIPSLRSSP